MENLETKSPELTGGSEKMSTTLLDSKDSKKEAKPEYKAPPKEVKKAPPSLFEKPKEPAKPESIFDTFEKKANKNPPLEQLATEEKVLVVEDQTEQNLAAANSELVGVEPSSPAEAAAIAGATYNEAVRERIENGEQPTPDMLDGAMNDTAEILGLSPDEIDESEPVLPVVVDLGEVEPAGAEPMTPLADEVEPPHAETPDVDAELPEPPAVELPAVPIEPPVVPPVNPNAAPPSPPIPPAGPGAGGPGGPGGPLPPVGPGFGGGFNMPPINPNLGNALAATMNVNPWLNPNLAANLVTTARPNRRPSMLPYVLVGGVVGYLIGRRRGRIKTEKKLLPVQQKLENQVGDLQYQVALREAQIRKLAYEKATTHPHIFVELPKRLKELQELQKASLKKKDFETPKTKNGRLGKEAAAVVMSVELLEKVTDMTERPSRIEAKEVPKRIIHTGESLKPAQDMALADLLAVAAQIPIEDRDLRYLYESGRIDQQGLRKVIEAYLRGERYDKILREKLTGSETIATLPDVTSNPAAIPEAQMGAITVSAGDPLLVTARQQYYETLSMPETEFEQTPTHTVTFVVAVVIIIAIIVTGMFVF